MDKSTIDMLEFICAFVGIVCMALQPIFVGIYLWKKFVTK
jgi:hypothetical protein